MNLDQARAVAQRLRKYYNIHEEAADTIDALVVQVDRLQNHIHTCGPTCTKAGCINAALHEENETLRYEVDAIPAIKAERDAAQAEVERLTACLAKANSNHEEFERKWYLACDERDNLLNGG